MDNPLDQPTLLLTAEEARVLGCLMEKSVTTPDAYPLTFNSLLIACNQKTNRYPVVDYDENTVAEAIEGLREKHLLYRVDGAGSRVQKYKHRIDERLGLTAASQALLTVLLLRGAQTLGELRTRTERMHSFVDIQAVEAEITVATADIEIPLWKRFALVPGQKEAHYMHLLCGAAIEPEMPAAAPSLANPAIETAQQRNERMSQLEKKVQALEAELAEIRTSFTEFRQQFD